VPMTRLLVDRRCRFVTGLRDYDHACGLSRYMAAEKGEIA
jgi:hypothetical protein